MQKIQIMTLVLIGMHTINLKKKFFLFSSRLFIFKKNLSKYEKNDLTTFRYFLSLNKIGGRKLEKTRKNIQNRIHDLFKKSKKRIKKIMIFMDLILKSKLNGANLN